MSSVAMVRPRYVAFLLSGPVPLARRDVAAALTSAAKQAQPAWQGAPPQLTRYAWPHGIARVEHDQLAALRALLKELPDRLDGATLRTLSTSGTLDALTSRLGVLAERAERPPPPAAASRRGGASR